MTVLIITRAGAGLPTCAYKLLDLIFTGLQMRCPNKGKISNRKAQVGRPALVWALMRLAMTIPFCGIGTILYSARGFNLLHDDYTYYHPRWRRSPDLCREIT